jgi:hypothetical protein
VHCALGHDLGPPDRTDVSQRVADAANAASNAAQDEMRHLHAVNRALVDAGRPAEVGRADALGGIALGPLTQAELQNLVTRERDLAAAVDAAYAGLGPGLADVLGHAPDHSGFPAALYDLLNGIDPSHYIRAVPVAPGDDLVDSLLELSDHLYRVVVEILASWFPDEDALPAGRGLAIDAMTGLDEVNRLLVTRGALPAFTAVDA